MDPLERRGDLRRRCGDPVDEQVAAAGLGELRPAGGAGRCKQPEADAGRGGADEPDVVAADPDRHERGVAREGAELRRVVAAEHGLRREHVLGRGGRATLVAERRRAGGGRHQRRIVVVRSQAADRCAVQDGHERGRRVGVAERDVDAGARARWRSRGSAANSAASRQASRRTVRVMSAVSRAGRSPEPLQPMPTIPAQTQLPAPLPPAHNCAARRSCSAFEAR